MSLNPWFLVRLMAMAVGWSEVGFRSLMRILGLGRFMSRMSYLSPSACSCFSVIDLSSSVRAVVMMIRQLESFHFLNCSATPGRIFVS